MIHKIQEKYNNRLKSKEKAKKKVLKKLWNEHFGIFVTMKPRGVK